MSDPGYLASFEEDSTAQSIAAVADAVAEEQAEGLYAPDISIPVNHLVDEQSRFEGLSSQGHRGTAKLYMEYHRSEIANRDAQLNYDMFRDAALPAETSAERFHAIAELASFDLSEESVRLLTKNVKDEDEEGNVTKRSSSPLQGARVDKGGGVAEASRAVTAARRDVRTAHLGLKQNMLAVKKRVFEEKREAAAGEAEAYEQKIATIGRALDFAGLVFGSTSAATSVIDVVTTEGGVGENVAGDVGAAADVGGAGTALVKFGADRLMGGKLDALKIEIASHQGFVEEIAGEEFAGEIAKNWEDFTNAITSYSEAATSLETAVETRRKEYAQAGIGADAVLEGTDDAGDEGSQAMLFGSAAEEAHALLEAAIVEHEIAAASVLTAKEAADARGGTWWYKDAGSFYAPSTEFETTDLGGGPDVTALRQAASVLQTWRRTADRAMEHLDGVTTHFESQILRPAAGGTSKGDGDVY